MTSWRSLAIVLLSALAPAVGAAGQAPINSNVALQPSKGGLIIRQQFRYAPADGSTPDGDLDIRQTTSITTLVYGLTEQLTLILDTPFVISRHTENTITGDDDTDSGFADLRLLAKLRLYRDDTGPNDTTRVGLLAGTDLPIGHAEFTSESVDPIIGAVFTRIQGRHSFDADALWTFNTGGGRRGDDLLRYDLAYIYRLTPAVYESMRPTALFASLELNGYYETNGDQEIFLSPGLQFVTTRWILEATVQVPVWQDLAHRPERRFIVGVGIRLQF